MTSKNNGKQAIYTLNMGGKLLPLEHPLVMGILNVNHDSFYEGSRVTDPLEVVDMAGRMLEEGATFLDLGGQSTRPRAETVGPEEEAARVLPAIAAVLSAFPDALVSVDTYHARVASKAVREGARMVNDVSSGNLDPAMIPTVAALGVPYIAMHMQGTPGVMQDHPHYDNVTREVLEFLGAKAHECKKAGILDVILDPGFGFGKTKQHNFQLLRQLDLLSTAGRPILVGLSRKSTIYRTLGTGPEGALHGTLALHTVALLKGAHILRVHDVKPAMDAIRMVEALGA